jgi:hypothetical protein
MNGAKSPSRISTSRDEVDDSPSLPNANDITIPHLKLGRSNDVMVLGSRLGGGPSKRKKGSIGSSIEVSRTNSGRHQRNGLGRHAVSQDDIVSSARGEEQVAEGRKKVRRKKVRPKDTRGVKLRKKNLEALALSPRGLRRTSPNSNSSSSSSRKAKGKEKKDKKQKKEKEKEKEKGNRDLENKKSNSGREGSRIIVRLPRLDVQRYTTPSGDPISDSSTSSGEVMKGGDSDEDGEELPNADGIAVTTNGRSTAQTIASIRSQEETRSTTTTEAVLSPRAKLSSSSSRSGHLQRLLKRSKEPIGDRRGDAGTTVIVGGNSGRAGSSSAGASPNGSPRLGRRGRKTTAAVEQQGNGNGEAVVVSTTAALATTTGVDEAIYGFWTISGGATPTRAKLRKAKEGRAGSHVKDETGNAKLDDGGIDADEKEEGSVELETKQGKQKRSLKAKGKEKEVEKELDDDIDSDADSDVDVDVYLHTSQIDAPDVQRVLGLPLELVLHVFSFLGPKDLVRACHVSHQWHALCESDLVWKPLIRSLIHRPIPTAPVSARTSPVSSGTGIVTRPAVLVGNPRDHKCGSSIAGFSLATRASATSPSSSSPTSSTSSTSSSSSSSSSTLLSGGVAPAPISCSCSSVFSRQSGRRNGHELATLDLDSANTAGKPYKKIFQDHYIR